jgi:hypothetical protein
VKINIGAGPFAVLGATMTAISGACWGYVLANKELEEKFDNDLRYRLDIEVDKVRGYYAVLNKDTQPEDHSEGDIPDDVVIDSQNIVIPKELLATPEGRAAVMAQISEAIEPGDARELVGEDRFPEEEPEAEPVVVNAFDEQELLNERGGDAPYVISKEEFLRNSQGYETYKLTWFEGDGVLVDDQDDAIPDTQAVVGDKNLQRFGQLSENNNVVYIQNDSSSCLFEIVRTNQTSSEALFGIEDEDAILEHSSMKRRRPRRGDE